MSDDRRDLKLEVAQRDTGVRAKERRCVQGQLHGVDRPRLDVGQGERAGAAISVSPGRVVEGLVVVGREQEHTVAAGLEVKRQCFGLRDGHAVDVVRHFSEAARDRNGRDIVEADRRLGRSGAGLCAASKDDKKSDNHSHDDSEKFVHLFIPPDEHYTRKGQGVD